MKLTADWPRRAKQRHHSALVLKDPYILIFCLKDRYLEKTWKTPSCASGKLLAGMGAGLYLCRRQKRLQIDNDDFYIDCYFTTAA